MRIITITGLIVLTVASNAFADVLPENSKDWDAWTACSADEQCVAIHDECGGWTAVNIQSRDKGEEYQRNLGTAGDCGFVRLSPEPKTLCISRKCTVKPTGMDLN